MNSISKTLAQAMQNYLCGHLDAAEQAYRQILQERPKQVIAIQMLGVIALQLGQKDTAVEYLQRAVELREDIPEFHNSLGNALDKKGQFDEAVASYRRAIELNMDFAEAYNNIGNVLAKQANMTEAIDNYRRALVIKEDYAEAHSNLLLTLHYCPGVTPASLAEAHAAYNRQHALSLRSIIPHHDEVIPGRQNFRLGFVSPDFGRHPIGYFLGRVLEYLRQEQHTIFCYSDRIAKDNMTLFFQNMATNWRDVRATSHDQLTEQIRADNVDILFDLAGHTAGNRLLVFARKPAPIQITWAGYVGTTGLTAMDYLLADQYEVPVGADATYSETVLRMPDGYVCYDPPAYAPPVAPLPAMMHGYMTFGSFNNPLKINANVIEVWAEVLKRVPESRLLLKYRGMDSPFVSQSFAARFAQRGIDPRRIEFLGYSRHAESLAEYSRVDLALDPFPYSGGLTTCEALWMGVPVITFPGDTFASRHSFSHLSNIGLTETIARNLPEYIDLAVNLAEDKLRLASLRAGLRERVASSPLCDAKRFATNLISLLHEVWNRPRK